MIRLDGQGVCVLTVALQIVAMGVIIFGSGVDLYVSDVDVVLVAGLIGDIC